MAHIMVGLWMAIIVVIVFRPIYLFFREWLRNAIASMRRY